jgi:hypothetical protein
MIYAISIHANPGIYGQDDQGNAWTTFSLINGSIACDECGAQIDGGYMRGKWSDEQLHVCCSHVRTQIGAHIGILTALEWRIAQEAA